MRFQRRKTKSVRNVSIAADKERARKATRPDCRGQIGERRVEGIDYRMGGKYTFIIEKFGGGLRIPRRSQWKVDRGWNRTCCRVGGWLLPRTKSENHLPGWVLGCCCRGETWHHGNFGGGDHEKSKNVIGPRTTDVQIKNRDQDTLLTLRLKRSGPYWGEESEGSGWHAFEKFFTRHA